MLTDSGYRRNAKALGNDWGEGRIRKGHDWGEGKPDYLLTSPYNISWLDKTLSKSLRRGKKANYLKDMGDCKEELLIMTNVVRQQHTMRAHAIRKGMDIIHTEDGFVPHYQTMHVDPLGFCWDSSLTKMTFRKLEAPAEKSSQGCYRELRD